MANLTQLELPNGTTYNFQDTISGYVATDATTSAHGLMSASDKTKLNGIASGAEVNQNAFSNITVGTTTVAADSKTDTLTLVGGANITLTPDATNDKITILLDDTVDTGEVIATEVQAGDLVVSGSSRFLNTINGDISGNATTATKVGTDLKIQLNGGTTEGTNQFTYNGSTAKSLNITKSSIGLGNVENKSSATIRGELTSSNVTTALGFTPYNAASAGTAAGKNYTTSVTSGSADLVTSGAVWTAIDNLPEPMVFKGSLGTGGTITALPTASSANTGYTYKVITAGTYASQAAKVGDTFISDGTAWVLIPSGDEPSGTVTSITLKAGTGISLDIDNTAITTSGTRTITNSGVRATTINGNYLRVNTGGTNADLTIPYATKATQDSDGNAINTTYLKLSGGTVTGQTTFNKSIHDVGGQTIFAGGATSSAWYKITLATNGITPPSSQQWYMCSMTIHVGGSYGSAAKGIIELSYYIYWTGTAFQATNVYATGIGNNLQNVILYYKLTDPFIIYANVANSYTSLWVDKVSYRDSSYGYRTNETKVEVSDAITTTDYSTIPIAKVYSTNGTNIFLNNSTFPASNNTYNLGDPSYKWANIYATKFIGALQGNADTATSATKDGSGNVITSTYATITGTVGYLGNLNSIGAGTPAAATKTYWENNIGNLTSKMAYNSSGAEYSIFFNRGASASYGTVLKWGYSDKYIYMLRKYGNSWSDDDWAKIYAGYADSAGSASTATSATKAAQDSDGNTINTTYVKKAGDTMTGKLIVPKTRIANTCYGVSFGRTTNTPVETILYTGIKWISGTHMPVVHITGYAYGLQAPVEFKVGFYIYSDKIGWCGVTNMGAWQPDVYLFKYTRDSVNYVAVGFAGSCYFLQLQADVQDEMGKFNYISMDDANWSWEFLTTAGTIPTPDSGTTCIKVPYMGTILALPLAGGTMSGTIVTPTNDNMGIEPATTNYGQVGSSTKYFYRSYINHYYGTTSHINNWDSNKNIGTPSSSSAAATRGYVNFYNECAAGGTQTKTTLYANVNATANTNISLPTTSGTLALTDGSNASGTWGINISGTAQAVAWENVTGKPSTFAPSAHDHSQIVTVGDKRTTATTPNDYANKMIFQGLKTQGYIDNPGGTSGYSYLVGLRGWSDSSGGDSHELAFNNNGIYWRHGATTTWGSWTRLFTVSDTYSGTLTSSQVTTALGYTPPSSDTKNTAGSTDTSSKIYLIGATSQAANPQTYSDDQVYVTSGVLSTNGHTSTGNIVLSSSSGDSPQLQFLRGSSLTKWRMYVASGQLKFDSSTDGSTWTNRAYFGDNNGILTLQAVSATGNITAGGYASITGNVECNTIYANRGANGTAGGISLYSNSAPSAYGIANRNTTQGGKFGYVQGDWAGYYYMSGAVNRGWIWRHGDSINVASVSGEGHIVTSGSLTLGGNTTNTSGVRQVYNSTTQSLDFVFAS